MRITRMACSSPLPRFDDPEIVICVVGEAAGHGSSVAPVVRDILDAYFAEEEPDTIDTVQPENTMVP